MDDATVEAIAVCEDCYLATARDAEKRGLLVSDAAVKLCAKHLPDPRPTEAEAFAATRAKVPVGMPSGQLVFDVLRGLGCFRPEEDAEPPVDAPPEPERPTTGPHESVTDRSTPVAPLDTPQGGQL